MRAWTSLKAVLVQYRSAESECVCHERPTEGGGGGGDTLRASCKNHNVSVG